MKYISFVFLLFAFTVSAQIKIIDSVTSEPIPLAHILTSDGNIGVISDLEGVISNADIQHLLADSCANYTIQHVAYNSKQISKVLLQAEKEISLSPRVIALNEFVVTPNAKNYDFIALKAFFRSYVLQDNEAKFYVDGIVTYYIPVKKRQIKISLDQYRVFSNKNLISKDKNSFLFSVNDRPELPNIIDFEKGLGKSYTIQTSSNGYNIMHKNSVAGSVVYFPQSNHSILHIDRMAPDSMKVFTLFKNRIEKKKWLNSARYLSRDAVSMEIKNLESIKEYYNVLHYSGNNRVDVACLKELFIIEQTYVSKSELKKIETKTSTKIPRGQRFHKDYWSEISKYNIPDIDDNLRRIIAKSLKPEE